MTLPQTIQSGRTKYTLVNGVYQGSDGSTKTPQELGYSGDTPTSSTDQNTRNLGPNSGISTTYGPIDPSVIKNELKDFGDKNNFDKLKPFLFYPENIGKTGQDRIVIRQVEYVPAPITEGTTLPQTINALSNRDGQFTKGLGEVILPIPNEISETNTTGWGEDSLSAIAGALMGQASGFARGVAEVNAPVLLGSLREAFNNLGDSAVKSRLERYLVSNAAASILKLGNINVNPEAFLTRATGVSINPNLELLFNGPKLRQFGFSFKMTPRSEKEARHIRAIIKFFKKGMAPRRSSQSENKIFLGSPNVFKMEFQSGSGGQLKSIGQIKTCALVSCGVNYTPDGFYAAFNDPSAGGSQPISVVLSLGFTELTPIFNDEYDADSEDKLTNIGPEGFNFVADSTGGNNQ